jgi:hypothetical protein
MTKTSSVILGIRRLAERLQNQLLNIFLFLGLFLIFFLPPLDPDLGWQLRCGQQLWQTGHLCSENHFSVLAADYRWTLSYLLYQVLIYPVYQVLGFTGLSLINALLLATTFFLFTNLKGDKNLKITLLPIVILLSWSVFGLGLRAQLFSLFYLILLLYLKDKRKLLLTPLVMWLWANTHGSFVLGFLFLPFIGSFPVAIMSILVTFLNPFGARLYQEAYRHLFVAGLDKLIAEWVPPPLTFQILIIILSLVVILVIRQNGGASRIFSWLLLGASAFLALKARRNLDYFFPLVFYFLTQKKFKAKFLPALSLLVISGLFCFGLFIQLPRTLLAKPLDNYPQKATAFLNQQPVGNVFNTYEWGGYLIWYLPQFKIFVDGRMPAWPTPEGKSPYTLYLETLQTQPGWEESLTKYHIKYLFRV